MHITSQIGLFLKSLVEKLPNSQLKAIVTVSETFNLSHSVVCTLLSISFSTKLRTLNTREHYKYSSNRVCFRKRPIRPKTQNDLVVSNNSMLCIHLQKYPERINQRSVIVMESKLVWYLLSNKYVLSKQYEVRDAARTTKMRKIILIIRVPNIKQRKQFKFKP